MLLVLESSDNITGICVICVHFTNGKSENSDSAIGLESSDNITGICVICVHFTNAKSKNSDSAIDF